MLGVELCDSVNISGRNNFPSQALCSDARKSMLNHVWLILGAALSQTGGSILWGMGVKSHTIIEAILSGVPSSWPESSSSKM